MEKTLTKNDEMQTELLSSRVLVVHPSLDFWSPLEVGLESAAFVAFNPNAPGRARSMQYFFSADAAPTCFLRVGIDFQALWRPFFFDFYPGSLSLSSGNILGVRSIHRLVFRGQFALRASSASNAHAPHRGRRDLFLWPFVLPAVARVDRSPTPGDVS